MCKFVPLITVKYVLYNLEVSTPKKHSRQIAGIAAKEWTCVPCHRDRNIYRYKLKTVIDAAQKAM